MKNAWDKKAQRYGRYTTDPNTLEADMFRLMREMGVDFADKRVIDIGCGTGVYTLHIAREARHVDALDISAEMLAILQEDARRHGITTLHTLHSDWEPFPLPQIPYDYALSTMSPATRTPGGFAKMSRAATVKIFLGWGDKKGTSLLEELFAAHGSVYTPPNGAVKLRAWLETNNIRYQLREYAETKTRIKTLTKAIESYGWRLEAHGITPDPERIRSVLEAYQDREGNVVETVVNDFNLIVWK